MAKERPILFSGPMVRAILEGRKTQTRRAINPSPLDIITKREPWAKYAIRVLAEHRCWCAKYEDNPPRGKMIYCRFGEVGDRLWVKERVALHMPGDTFPGGVAYHATDAGLCASQIKWCPAIHMPRTASRIELDITCVRPERLHEIGKDGRKAHDVLAEGIDPSAIAREREWFHPDDSPAIAYSRLWNEINGAGSWDANPWVWVVEFRRTKP